MIHDVDRERPDLSHWTICTKKGLDQTVIKGPNGGPIIIILTQIHWQSYIETNSDKVTLRVVRCEIMLLRSYKD